MHNQSENIRIPASPFHSPTPPHKLWRSQVVCSVWKELDCCSFNVTQCRVYRHSGEKRLDSHLWSEPVCSWDGVSFTIVLGAWTLAPWPGPVVLHSGFVSSGFKTESRGIACVQKAHSSLSYTIIRLLPFVVGKGGAGVFWENTLQRICYVHLSYICQRFKEISV